VQEEDLGFPGKKKLFFSDDKENKLAKKLLIGKLSFPYKM